MTREFGDIPKRNPLAWLAFVSGLGIARGAWQLLSGHNSQILVLVDLLVWVAFLILYLRRSRFAWHVIMFLFGCWAPLEAWIFRAIAHKVSPSLLVFLGTLLLWLAFVGYVVWLRKRYFVYLDRA